MSPIGLYQVGELMNTLHNCVNKMSIRINQLINSICIWVDDDVFRTIQDMFNAGSETTSTTLRWSFLYLLTYPDVYKRCQDEIEQVSLHTNR
jgi:hypothetical protein